MIVAVTGATGFVGGGVCAELVRGGHEVVAVTRRDASGPWSRAELVGDLATGNVAAALSRAMRGVDVVVHLAARVHVMHENARNPEAAFREANVYATGRVVEAAVRAGVRRVVLLSTVKVLGEERDEPYVEDDSLLGADPYARSKAAAEALVRGSAREIEGVIIRPPLVYGPGVGGNFARLLRLADISRRIPLPLASVGNRRSMISLMNLASAVGRCVVDDAAAGETFLVADAESPSTPELLELAAGAIGGHARLFHAPPRLLAAGAAAIGKRAEARRLLNSLTVSTARIRGRLGWSPVQSLADGVRTTARWYAAQLEGHA